MTSRLFLTQAVPFFCIPIRDCFGQSLLLFRSGENRAVRAVLPKSAVPPARQVLSCVASSGAEAPSERASLASFDRSYDVPNIAHPQTVEVLKFELSTTSFPFDLALGRKPIALALATAGRISGVRISVQVRKKSGQIPAGWISALVSPGVFCSS
jgi:hypothetical protein